MKFASKSAACAVAGLFACLSLVACGGGVSDGTSSGSSSTPDEADSTRKFAEAAESTSPEAAAAAARIQIAIEGQAFTVSGTQTVRYGADARWVQKAVTSGGSCTNVFFGVDPAYGVLKSCQILSAPPPPPEPTWTQIATEGQSFAISGTQIVRYGADTRWVQKSVTNSGSCTNNFFGIDPAYGVFKSCQTPAPAPPAVVDITAPTVPTNLSATPLAPTQVRLAWTASTDAVGVALYRIERCTGAACVDFVLLADAGTTTYSDVSATAGTAYGYRVSARDAAGNSSAASGIVRATTAAATSTGAATVAGAVTVPFPTQNNLSIEWSIGGDDNLNGVVSVRYRPTGSSVWKQSMPLRRTPAGSNEGFTWTNRHSGSVFDLQPATAYEVELTLTDPDGGSAATTMTATTRSVPAPMAGAPIKAVTPATFASVAAGARPGDILELAAGNYTWPNWSVSGTSGAPIVVRSSAGAVINGEVGLFARHYVHLSGLTINGRIRFNASNNVAITRCRINATSALSGDGIVTYLRAENAYIADNTIVGLTTWAASSFGVNGSNLGEGIVVTGPGHVIMNNRVSGFRDGISLLEQTEAVDQFSIDILNNEISESADDGIEADFCMHNCRIMRNRMTNSFVAMSSQPGLGGPTYFIRNVAYNVAHVAFKLYRGSIGDVLLHNTVVKNGDALAEYSGVQVARTFSRNNLVIGGPGATYNGFSSGSGRVISFSDLVASGSSMDYDALGSTTGSFTGNLGGVSFSSLAALRSGTTEKNAIQADLGMFAATVAFPGVATTKFVAPDLRPKAGSALENSALPIPGINDVAATPDMGAYEVGAALPVYGPR